MATDRIKTPVSSLVEGMFVADLDRPWHETPFPLQGFYVRSLDDVKALAPYCSFVYIDVKKTRSNIDYSAEHAVAKPIKKEKASRAKKNAQVAKVVELPPINIKNPNRYEVAVPLPKEAKRVKKIHQEIKESVRAICESVEAGEAISVKQTESVAVSMVVSVVRNPDALVWLAKMDDEDSHAYQHVVRASIWALVFARHLGLSKPLMKTLATGVLLSHVGLTQIPEELRRPVSTLTDEELVTYKSYVDLGVSLLKDETELGDGVLNIVEFHRERHNGTGYPKGLTGDQIPLLAKIAGLVDEYQDHITPRGDSFGMSPREAVAKLYDERNILFQKDLVERFIEAIGVYPTGTLVELNNEQVGIVTGHNEGRRLLPNVIVVMDKDKQALKSGKKLDLMEWNDSHSEEDALYIKDSLPKGAYDIDENRYLLSGATSRWSIKHLAANFS